MSSKKTNTSSNGKLDVVFVIPKLSPGGAERVFAFISQNLDSEKFRTELLIIGSVKDTSYIVDNVRTTYLNQNRVLYAIPKVIEFLLRRKPRVVLSSIGHVNFLFGFLSFLFPKIRFVIRPSNVGSKNSAGWFEKKCFSSVESVICQSSDMSQNFQKRYGISEDKITIIGNPVTNVENISTGSKIHEYFNFITVGRLSSIKGHSRILNILAKLNKDFHYLIIGDGPEKENLLERIETLNLGSRITHIPYTDKVNHHLERSDIFLQGSFSEGFPNAVLESCIMGTPVLAFDVPGGTKEIVQNGINGYLVNTEEEYLSILNEPREWNRFDVRQSVLSKYGASTILSRYEKVIENAGV